MYLLLLDVCGLSAFFSLYFSTFSFIVSFELILYNLNCKKWFDFFCLNFCLWMPIYFSKFSPPLNCFLLSKYSCAYMWVLFSVVFFPISQVSVSKTKLSLYSFDNFCCMIIPKNDF